MLLSGAWQVSLVGEYKYSTVQCTTIQVQATYSTVQYSTQYSCYSAVQCITPPSQAWHAVVENAVVKQPALDADTLLG